MLATLFLHALISRIFSSCSCCSRCFLLLLYGRFIYNLNADRVALPASYSVLSVAERVSDGLSERVYVSVCLS